MGFEQQLNDAISMERMLNNIDENTKYKIFFNDVISHHEEMIAKEEKYANEYISFLNPSKKLSFRKTIFSLIYIGVIITIIFLLVTTTYGTTIQNTVSGFFRNHTDKEEVILGIILCVPIQIACLGSLYFLIKSIKNVFQLIKLPFSYIRYFREKKIINEYLKNIKKYINIDIAKDTINKLDVLIANDIKQVKCLFEMYSIDPRLQNRENVEFIIGLLKYNKKKNPSIQDVTKFIITKNQIKETFPVDIWAKGLLLYDPNFIWYARENPWMKRVKEKNHFDLSIIFKLYGMLFQILFGGVDKEVIKNHTIASSSSNNTPTLTETVPFTPEESRKYVFRDSKGYLVESGSLFHDGKGNLCEPRGLFYDAKGNLCDSNSLYYDSKGNLCEPGGIFRDADGNMIDPG